MVKKFGGGGVTSLVPTPYTVFTACAVDILYYQEFNCYNCNEPLVLL